ncbi:MAG: acyl-CoA thioesterase [Treponemataceae bacterium]|nr:acyl-CoA thioesterase [Treponemataceae bacterium]
MKGIVISVEPRFYEVDSYQVVNNMFYLSWFEMGRFSVAEKAGLICERFKNEGLAFLVSHIDIYYKKPVVFRDKICCQTTIKSKIGAKLVFKHIIKKVTSHEVCSEGISEVVLMKNYKMQIKMPEWIDLCIARYIGEYQNGEFL